MTERRREVGSPILDGVPRALPALVRAARLGSHAGRVGFDFPAAGDVREKVAEELAELDAA
ncbi:MAG: nucleoside triphosphate pyrophosphohydrolase, partial [Steroidobacteraceae bacterium]